MQTHSRDNDIVVNLVFRYPEKDFKDAKQQVIAQSDSGDILDYFDYVGDKMMDLSYQDDASTVMNDHIFMEFAFQNMEMTVDSQGDETAEHVFSCHFFVRPTKDHPSVKKSIQHIKDTANQLAGAYTDYITITTKTIKSI